MTDSSPSVRRYTEEEVAELLRRATEDAMTNPPVGGDGLSLAEVQDIGREVGINPERLAVAARDLDQAVSKSESPLLGAPTRLHAEQRVVGTVRHDDIPELLTIIRRTMGQAGTVNEVHGALEWSSGTDGGASHVSISARGGVATISVSSNVASVAGMIFLPGGALGLVGTIMGFGTFMKSGTMLGLAFGVALLPTTYAALRQLFKRLSRAEARRLDALAAELAARIGDGRNP